MARLIDADALCDDVMERYCKDCEKRKGIKRGKWRVIYEIGEAPCRACDVDDLKMELDEAPTIDAEPVVRCCDCKYLQCNMRQDGILPFGVDEYECRHWCGSCDPTDFCSYGERREDVKVN